MKLHMLLTIGNCTDCTIKGFTMDGGEARIAASLDSHSPEKT
jgi:hypothetical protein